MQRYISGLDSIKTWACGSVEELEWIKVPP